MWFKRLRWPRVQTDFATKQITEKNRLTCIHSTVNETLIVIVLFVYHFIQRTDWSVISQRVMKTALRETQTLRARRQDRLQYTAPQLASAQCNNLSPCAPYIKGTWQLHKPIHLSKQWFIWIIGKHLIQFDVSAWLRNWRSSKFP